MRSTPLLPRVALLVLALGACQRPTATDGGVAADAGLAGCSAGCGADEVCVRDACFAVSCASGACTADEVCEDGQCVTRACAGLHCPETTKCLRGRCFAAQCGAAPCDAGAVCDGTRCIDERCAGVSCPVGVACREGACTDCLAGYVPLDGGCAPVRAAGDACGEATECETGVCANGRCCLTPCLGQCEGCDERGLCRSLARGARGPPACFPGSCGGNRLGCVEDCVGDGDCAAGAFCDRSGPSARCLPTLAEGKPCQRESQCSSGFCISGLCCDSACDGGCATCNGLTAAGIPAGTTPGQCSAVPQGTPPRGEPCGTFLCDGRSLGCPSTCPSDRACISSQWCGGEPATCENPLLGAGSPCDRPRQCRSNLCVDGVCCSGACAGECTACNLPGKEGLCAGETGTRASDGGYCSEGIICRQPCNGPCDRCSGANCVKRTDNGRDGVCGNFGCQPLGGDGGCFQACVKGTSTGCAAGFVCDATPVTGTPRCVLKQPLGGSCDAGAQCGSGQCCNSKCRDVLNDRQNCGECDRVCDSTMGGYQCQGGVCCELCDGVSCIDIRFDSQNCGYCTNVCYGTYGTGVCSNGSCCEDCGTLTCIDWMSDPAHCGACNNACSDTQQCVSGTCCETCGTGACVDFNSDASNCGACGVSCPGGGCVAGTCYIP